MNYCKKKSFESLSDASTRLKEIEVENGGKVNLRIYECPYCHKYHYTSMNIRVIDQIKNKNKEYHEKFIKREGRYWSEKFGEEY